MLHKLIPYQKLEVVPSLCRCYAPKIKIYRHPNGCLLVVRFIEVVLEHTLPAEYQLLIEPKNGIYKINDFLACNQHMVEYYNNRKNHIHDRFKPLLSTNDGIDMYGQDFGEEVYENDITYPFIHKYSQVIALYSVLEVTLREISRLIEIVIESNIRLHDIKKDQGVHKYRRFLNNSYGIKFPEKTNEFIAEFIQIRNALVHSNGVIKKIACVKTKYVMIDNKTITDIDNAYILNSCNEIIYLFHSIGRQIVEIAGVRTDGFFSPKYEK